MHVQSRSMRHLACEALIWLWRGRQGWESLQKFADPLRLTQCDMCLFNICSTSAWEACQQYSSVLSRSPMVRTS